ncbi:nucleotidyltransferase family protein [Croceicoccus bisphenolivorans]|uniref:nucleotidyltransferase family protein n=1 Tax=Croceicoccus bisphenolivorans TaxID=1783232 RepID=UPI0009EECF1D
MIPKAWRNVIRAWADRHEPIQSAYIFGSYAKGSATEGSDLDVAVIIKPMRGDEDELTTWIFERQKWAEDLDALLPPQIDLELISEDDLVVKPAVERDGILVYQRGH